MAQNFAVTSFIAKRMTDFMVQKSPIFNTFNRKFVGDFNPSGYAPGETVNVKIPGYQAVQRGATTTVQEISDRTIPFTFTENDIYNVTNELSEFEEIFEVVSGRKAFTKESKDDIVDNYCYPKFLSMEGALEISSANSLIKTAYITPVDVPADMQASLNSYNSIADAETCMTDMAIASDMRYAMLNTKDSQSVASSLQNMFNEVINEKITRTALVGKGNLAGFDMFRTKDMPTNLAGPQYAVSPNFTVGAVAADGTTITFAGVQHVTSILFKAGNRISIPSVNLLDPITKAVRSYRLVITVASDAVGDGAGNCVVTLSEPLIASGMNANVSAFPSVSAAAELYPNRKVNFFYTPAGGSAVPMPLKDIAGAENSNSKLSKTDVPVKTVIQGAVLDFTNILRTSMLVGLKTFAPYIVEISTTLD